jgi:hypothetical protein
MKRFFLLFFFLFPSVVLADDSKEEKPKVIYKERTEIDFEGVEIAGELVRPQGQLIMERHRAQFNPLIKLRTDFDKEMDHSVEEIK